MTNKWSENPCCFPFVVLAGKGGRTHIHRLPKIVFFPFLFSCCEPIALLLFHFGFGKKTQTADSPFAGWVALPPVFPAFSKLDKNTPWPPHLTIEHWYLEG